MSPGGRIAGWGRYPLWRSDIHPFRDRPEVPYPVVWHAVPADREEIPFSPFWERFYDGTSPCEQGTVRPGEVGQEQSSMVVYPSVLPADTLYPLDGTPEQWLYGCDYETWLAGGYSNSTPCIDANDFGPPGIADILDGIGLR